MDARIDFLCMQLKFFCFHGTWRTLLPKSTLRKEAAAPHLGEPKFPEWGIDISNTAAVIIAIEFFFSWFDCSFDEPQ
jgi:hypothetical protein